MGRGKNSQKKNNKKLKKILLSTFSVEELLKKAQDEIDVFNYKEAQKFCHEALQRDPENLRALEVSAGLCMEMGNFDGAKHCFGRAITLAPETGFTKYLSMGQLLEGRDSLQCYLKGIELIYKAINEEKESRASEKKSPQHRITEAQTKDGEDDDENICDETVSEHSKVLGSSNSLERKLSNAYCAVAELFMSDLCDEDEAETESLTNVQKAISVDSTNPEAYQYYANFLVIKEKIDEAKEQIKKSVSLWLPKFEAVDRGEACEGSFDPVEVCSVSESVRCKTAQILIEVEEHDLAEDVLKTLLAEDDEVVYTWYLLGLNEYLQGGEHKIEAKQHLQRALKIHMSSPTPDENIVDHMKEMMEELKETVIVEDEVDDDIEDIEELEEIEDMDVS